MKSGSPSVLGRPEHIGEEAAFRKIPVLLRHLGRRRASATARRRSRRRAGRRASGASGSAESAGAVRSVADEIGQVVAVAGRGSTSRPSRSRCPGNRRCCCRPGCCRPRRRPGSAARPAPATGRPADCRRSWRRSATIAGSSVGPSMPQLLLWLSSGAVAIVLAVGLVVLFVVAEQIGEREAVMHGDVIDAGARAAAVMVEQVGRAGHAAATLRRSGCLRRSSSAASSLR